MLFRSSNCGEMGHGPKVSVLHVAKGKQANINSVARPRLPRTVIPAVVIVAMVGETQVMLLVPLVPLKPLVLPGTPALVILHGPMAVVEAGRVPFTKTTSAVLF